MSGEQVRPQARAYEPVPPEALERVKEGLKALEKPIRERLGLSVKVDEQNSAVIIETASPQGSANVLKARDIVKAIVIGFQQQDITELLDDDTMLVVVDVQSAVNDRENHLRRVLGRIIGENGRAKRAIEEITGVKMAVSDSGQVGIIGDYERAMIARHGVELLVEGKMHGTVYKRLEAMMRDLKRREATELWYK
ncbi:MAG: KH domain-containing protein [Acidilobus sp.]|jgi:ribosomal RNA assembly protein